MFMVHRKELVEQIKQSFLSNDVDLSNCTIMTVGRIANRLGSLPVPALIITDETHHSLAKTYKKIYEYYKYVPRLGFTASPWRLSGAGLGDVYETMVEGPTVEWLIDNHYLAPYKYYSVALADADKLKRSSTGDYTSKSINDALGNVIFGDVIKTYKKLASGKQAIAYCHSIDFSKKIVDQFNEAGIVAAHADSKTPAGERDKIMSDFKSGRITIISNVDLISEGFNVPDCGVVIMLRPTESLVLDIQQSMRGMRYKPDKQSIIIDHVANYTRFGLPDTPRDWNLKGHKKHKSGSGQGVLIRQCKTCFGVFKASLDVCPYCGAKYETPDPTMNEEKNVSLTEITTDYSLTKYADMQPSEAKTASDMYKIAKARGYKPGWAYHQNIHFGLLNKKSKETN